MIFKRFANSLCKATMMSILMLCVLGTPLAAMASEKLNLGIIGSSPSKTIKQFKPLLHYLSAKGLPTGKVVVTKTVSEMIVKIKNEEVDFIFESPYGVVQMMDATGAVPVLIREKKGLKQYNSVVFVPKDSPIRTLSDLNGKVIAFEEPDSTSSFLLPKSILVGAGLTLSESSQPVPGQVAYYFSKDDDNTVAQVRAGKKADAGGIKKSAVDGNPEFRILTPESAYVPRHVLLVRKGVSFDRLKSLLLDAQNDPAASAALSAIKTPSGFSEFDGDPIAVMNGSVRKALGL
ncbi:MAG: phosphate/phosphite/phosphonate ABC transporter substrate-binding protein [Desulfosarcinaceae bacterium]|nr:phosphate/phosphite/phosphonate ABC transporter substrate-binding protein [Desulfosarcinaceae bacterium]